MDISDPIWLRACNGTGQICLPFKVIDQTFFVEPIDVALD